MAAVGVATAALIAAGIEDGTGGAGTVDGIVVGAAGAGVAVGATASTVAVSSAVAQLFGTRARPAGVGVDRIGGVVFGGVAANSNQQTSSTAMAPKGAVVVRN